MPSARAARTTASPETASSRCPARCARATAGSRSPRRAPCAPVNGRPLGDDAHAEPGADHDVDEEPAARADAEGVLAEGGEIGVVVDRERDAQFVAHPVEEPGPAPAGQVQGVAHPAGCGVVHARGADDGVCDLVGGRRRSRRRPAGRWRPPGRPWRPRCGPGCARRAGHHRAVEVGEGDPQPGAADVDAEGVTGRRVGGVEHGDPAAFGGVVAGLADQPGRFEGGERAGDGRLGQARLAGELGAGGGGRGAAVPAAGARWSCAAAAGSMAGPARPPSLLVMQAFSRMRGKA